MNEQKVLWQPSKDFVAQSNLKKFETWLRQHKGLAFDDYAQLWEWSVRDVAGFWEAVWDYFEIIAHSPYKSVYSGDEMPGTHWFEGSTLNYAEHIFRQKSTDRPALIFQSERHDAVEISWQELEAKVVAVQQYLKSCGIGKGIG